MALKCVLNKSINQVVTYIKERLCLFILTGKFVLLIPSEDHWLGLKNVFCLTKDETKTWTMRVDLWDHEGGTAYAQYTNFRLDDEETAFKLHVGEYSGNAGISCNDLCSFSHFVFFFVFDFHFFYHLLSA